MEIYFILNLKGTKVFSNNKKVFTKIQQTRTSQKQKPKFNRQKQKRTPDGVLFFNIDALYYLRFFLKAYAAPIPANNNKPEPTGAAWSL